MYGFDIHLFFYRMPFKTVLGALRNPSWAVFWSICWRLCWSSGAAFAIPFDRFCWSGSLGRVSPKGRGGGGSLPSPVVPGEGDRGGYQYRRQILARWKSDEGTPTRRHLRFQTSKPTKLPNLQTVKCSNCSTNKYNHVLNASLPHVRQRARQRAPQMQMKRQPVSSRQRRPSVPSHLQQT